MSSVFVVFIPAAPANRENVGRAAALVAQDSRADQRDAAMKSAKLSKRMALSAQGSIRTERTENRRVINACVGSGRSRYPAISLQSAEVAIPKSDLKSAAYEIRTKSAKSGALETNGRRERISGHRRGVEVRRFSREARGYWAFVRARNPAENVGRD
jgi:hypothetical protein